MRRHTVLIADDHAIVKEGLVRLLTEHDFDVVGAVGDGHELMEAAKRLRPDVIVTDVSNGGSISAKGLEHGVRLVLADVTGGTGGSVTSEDGDVTVKFPEGATFSVSALATEDGKVNASALEGACVADIAAPSSASFTCGDTPQGEPHFTVTAGMDGVGPSNIYLSF